MQDTENQYPISVNPILHLVKDFTKVRYREVQLQIANAGEMKSIQYEVDNDIKRIIAVQVIASRPDLAWYRGSFRVDLDNKELFPDDTPAKLFMAGNECAPHNRFTVVDRNAGSGNIKLRYQDTNHASTTFATYTVSLMLMCEIGQ